MTLTELKYIVAVAREKHFGKAAEACFVSQPTLSLAIKKLEEELEVKLFERSASEVSVTLLGEEIVRQAQSVLEQAAEIKEIAKRGKDPLSGTMRLGVIYTIGPYLLPDLVRQIITDIPQMPLNHPLAKEAFITPDQLKNETMLLLGTGHCFRDHVLEVCPEFARYASQTDGIRKTFEGSSLETIKHMVAAGMGVTLVPRMSVPDLKPVHKRSGGRHESPVRYLPIVDPLGGKPPTRRVVLAWRRSYTRYEAIAAVRNAIYACPLPGVTRLS
jgi:LysR family hydrogen peroxide-inducible transcriptional activator